MQKKRQFSNTFCFIDKLCGINDNSELEKKFKDVYSPELGLKKENVSNCQIVNNLVSKLTLLRTN